MIIIGAHVKRWLSAVEATQTIADLVALIDMIDCRLWRDTRRDVVHLVVFRAGLLVVIVLVVGS